MTQFQAFGFTFPLNRVDWTPCTVRASTPVLLVVIPRKRLERLVSRISAAQENMRLMEFLVKTVPGAKQLGSSGRERLLGYFDRIPFKNTEVILRENEPAQHVFIIYEGDCLQVSTNDPTGKLGPSPQTVGLMSKTTSCYNLGIITAGEWIGDDSVLYEKPMSYSVIATSFVKTLRISREKMLEKLNKDTLQTLRENVEKKDQWREARKKTIRKSILANVYQTDVESVGQAIHHTEKNYPTACKPAIVNIQRLELSKVDFNSKILSSTPSRRISPRPLTAQVTPKTRMDDLEGTLDAKPGISLKIRPISAANVGHSAFFSRPQTAKATKSTVSLMHGTVSSGSLLFSPETQDRKYLHSASTLGYLLAPVAPLVQYRRLMSKNTVQSPTSITTRNIKDHFGYTSRAPDTEATYAEVFYRKRPPSPNPAEQWSRRNNINIRELSAPRTFNR